MEDDKEFKSILRKAQLVAAANFFVIIVLAYMAYGILSGVGERDLDENMNTIVCIIAVISAAFVAVNLLLPRIASGWYRKDWDSMFKFWNIQSGLYFAISYFTFILIVMGAVWQTTLPFLIVSAIMSCTVFPTKKRWKKLMGVSDENQLF